MPVQLGTIPVPIPRGCRERGIRALRAELIKIDPRNSAMMSLGHLSYGEKEPPATENSSGEWLGSGAALGSLCKAWGVKSSWINGVSAWLTQLPPRQVSQIPCRHPRLGSAQLLCSCILLVQRQQPAGPCRWIQGDPSSLHLLSSGSAPIKLGFMGLPASVSTALCVQSQGFTTPAGVTWGQHFQMLCPEAWIHWALGLF